MDSSVQLIFGAAAFSDTAANVTAQHFGVVVKANDTDFGRSLVQGSNIDKALDFLGVSSIRYPGGTEARTDFSITDADDIAGLKRAIDYCAANGLSLNFTLNDTPYVNPNTGQAAMTSQERAELHAFLQDDLVGYANAHGVTIESIKIGNEFCGRTSDYGSPAVVGYANVAALLVNELDSFLDAYVPIDGYHRPGIVVEASGWEDGEHTLIEILSAAGAATKMDGLDLHGTENGSQGTPTLDLSWDHYFGTAVSDEPGVTYEARLTRIADIWTSNPDTANIELRVDAWCFPTTDEGPALSNAALAMLQLHTFSLVGIASATNYLGYGPDLSGLVRRVTEGSQMDLAVQTTAGGALFSMMEHALQGTAAIHLASTPLPAAEAIDSSLARAFAGDQKLVLFTVNRSTDDLGVDLVTTALTNSLEAFMGGVKTVSTSILGVTDPDMATLRQGVATVERVNLALSQLSAGGTDFTLNAYEIGQVVLMAAGTFGTNGADTMTGTSGADALHGLDGADRLSGGVGSDKLAGGDAADQLFGGAGSDMLYGGTGADALNGDQGIDTASYAFSSAGVTVNMAASLVNTGDAAGDTYTEIENIEGSLFADRITGDAAANLLSGGRGDDIFTVSGGQDTLLGGDGTDTILITGSAATTLSLFDGTNNLSLTYSGIENVTGSAGADKLSGNSGSNIISGDAGNDTLMGFGGDDNLGAGDGNDVLYGGAGDDWIRGNVGNDTEGGGDGNDTISGGSGADSLAGAMGNDEFVYYFKTEGNDMISDFGSTSFTDDDRFSISASGFGGGLAVGVLAAAQFVVRATDNFAQDSDDRFIFRASDKTLWFDANGSATGGAVLIADLQDDAANLTAVDIWLF